jgi:hypothetical protein
MFKSSMFKACPERSEGSFVAMWQILEAQDARDAHLEQSALVIDVAR